MPFPRFRRRVPTRLSSLSAVLIFTAMLVPGATLSAQPSSPDAFAAGAGGDLPLANAVRARPDGGAADLATADPTRPGFPSNPAGLAGADGWSFALAPVRLGLSLAPVTGADLAEVGGGTLSRERREAWLERIGTGEQRGEIDAGLGSVAVRRGSVALDFTTAVLGRSRLPADAVELLLFGNAGRDGMADDFRLTDAALDGAAWSRLALAWGGRPAPSSLSGLALGVRVHATLGHAVLVARDGGSVARGEEATATLRLPAVTSSAADRTPGFGVDFDVGAVWDGFGGRTGVTVHNVASSFGWSSSALRYRAGETLIEGAGVETDFEARPAREAPVTLLALADRLRPARRLDVEHVRPLGDAILVRVVFRERLERGWSPGQPNARLAGVEWRATGWLDLAAQTGAVEGGVRMGTGARVGLGEWAVAAALLVDRGADRDGSTITVSVGRGLRR